jgi:cytochrome c peroxidase
MAALAILALLACEAPAPPGAWDWPAAVGAPAIPSDNPMTPDKVELGRRLFSDTRLSGSRAYACATCHDPAADYGDGRVHPDGEDGDALDRNAPGLLGVAWYSTYTWANPLLQTLEEQALVPLVADAPPELGFAPVAGARFAELSTDPSLGPMIRRVFPGGFGFPEVVRALAAYERTLSAFDAPFDRGDLDDDARAGAELFGELGCDACHSGPTFSAAFRAEGDPDPGDAAWAATGSADAGLEEFTGDPSDQGRFRIPSLREVARTGPWLHDGSAPTLEAAISRYSGLGGEPGIDPRVRSFALTDAEVASLAAFLDALTESQ